MQPALKMIGDRLRDDESEALSRLFPEEGASPRAIVGAGGRLDTIDVSDLERALRDHRERVVKAGISAMEKIQDGAGEDDLDALEAAGLEVVLLLARPAIDIINGHFLAPGPPWEALDDERGNIEPVIASVGRIQVRGHRRRRWAGTGFLVGPDVVMTNAHVAEVFATGKGTRWSFRPGMSASVDWADDPDTDDAPEVAVTKVLGVHARFDLAVLRIDRDAGARDFLEPLTVAAEAPEPLAGRSVYVVGDPAFDRRNGGEAQRLIFADKYDVKRLQPGEILRRSAEPGRFDHDCSTLGGNSGSCVVDLTTHMVVGLHFQGEYLRHNQAVALWELADDPLLTGAGVLTG
jgi:hypothetical protein